MKKILVGLILLLSTTLVTASETVFEINNKLSNINIEGNSKEYIRVFEQLIDELRTDGIRFTYDGTVVKNGYNGVPYFLVKNVQIYIKKEVFEKYEKHASLLGKQTFFNDAIKGYGHSYIFFNSKYQWAKPKLKLKMEIMDDNNKVMYSRDLKTQFMVDGTGVTFENFFKYLSFFSKENKDFRDESIAEKIDIFRNQEIDMTLDEMQRIKSLKFRVYDN